MKLLIELQHEEIPARFLRKGREELGARLLELLSDRFYVDDESGTRTGAEEAKTEPDVENRAVVELLDETPAYTCRRTAWVFELPADTVPAKKRPRRGPKLDAPEKATKAFELSAKKKGYDSFEVVDGVRYAIKNLPAIPVGDYLRSALGGVLTDYVWPKSMRLGHGSFQWARPLNAVTILCDDKPVTGKIALGDGDYVPLVCDTPTHPALGEEPGYDARVRIASVDDYRETLGKAGVIVDANERKEILTTAAAKKGIPISAGLIEELAGLSEYPYCETRTLESRWSRFPTELLVEVLEKQLRCPISRDPKKGVDYLVTLDHPKGVGAMIDRYGTVISARLRDAEFFVSRDEKRGLEKMRSAMSDKEYYGGVAYGERSKRLRGITASWRSRLESASPGDGQIIDYLCDRFYADLDGETVNEFPKLRGIMGAHYYRGSDVAKGHADRVVEGVYQGLRSLYAPEPAYGSPAASAFYVAERLERLTLLWRHGAAPTGRGDPYAMRRAALEIIRAIENPASPIDIDEATQLALFGDDEKLRREVADFVMGRAGQYYVEQGYDVRVVAALASGEYGLTRLSELKDMIRQLTDLTAGEKGGLPTATWKRVDNILKNAPVTATFDESLAIGATEKALYEKYLELIPDPQNRFAESLDAIKNLAPALDAFMNDPQSRVLDCPDPIQKNNRLALLYQIRTRLLNCADFSKIFGV